MALVRFGIRQHEEAGVHSILYRFGPDDYPNIDKELPEVTSSRKLGTAFFM